jgi:hypothetical protein
MSPAGERPAGDSGEGAPFSTRASGADGLLSTNLPTCRPMTNTAARITTAATAKKAYW